MACSDPLPRAWLDLPQGRAALAAAWTDPVAPVTLSALARCFGCSSGHVIWEKLRAFAADQLMRPVHDLSLLGSVALEAMKADVADALFLYRIDRATAGAANPPKLDLPPSGRSLGMLDPVYDAVRLVPRW